MYLEGQPGERGYAMAALLVSLAVMSVLMSAALPTWRHAAQREKEAELVFRGEQYARAVALFRAKNGNAFPPNIDVLVQGKFLRKKYLDPMTNKEFEVIGAAAQAAVPGPQGGARGGPGATPVGRGGAADTQLPSAFSATPVSGGIAGVHSKSEETSIRVYRGQTKYNLWNFVFTAANRPGSATPGALNPGGGGRGDMPGGGGTGRGTGPGGGSGGVGPGGRGPQGPGGRGPGNAPPTAPFGSGNGRIGGAARLD